MIDRRDLLRSRFDHGLDYAGYKATMRENRDVIDTVEDQVVLDHSCLEALSALPRPIRAIAIVEDWCRDSVDNLPMLALLAEASGKLDLRIFSKDEHPDLMALYLKEGKYESLPVFAFLEEDFEEIGRFIERPDSVTELRARLKRERGAPQAAAPRELVEAIRRETRPFATAEVQRELTDIFKPMLSPSG